MSSALREEDDASSSPPSASEEHEAVMPQLPEVNVASPSSSHTASPCPSPCPTNFLCPSPPLDEKARWATLCPHKSVLLLLLIPLLPRKTKP